MPGQSEESMYEKLSEMSLDKNDRYHPHPDHQVLMMMDEGNHTDGSGGGGGGHGALFTMNSMKSSHRYISSESLETNSSSESSSNPVLNVQHRKDHEFIPTRMKQINVSKPAADPTQFTRLPSNPLLVSAQKQLMLVQEIKKAKETMKQPRAGDEEPDWQSDFSSWKNRRRKQSEETLQRVAQVKDLADEQFDQSRPKGLGRKLSSLMYTAPEDDWSDLGLEKGCSGQGQVSTSDSHNQQSPSQTSLSSAPTTVAGNRTQLSRRSPSPPAAATHPKAAHARAQSPAEADRILSEQLQASQHSTSPVPKFQEVSEKAEVHEPSQRCVQVSVISRQLSKPLVTYTHDPNPPVRRKTSELSASMKTRLEAFTSAATSPQPPDATPSETTTSSLVGSASTDRIPPADHKFHEKLETFRKISAGGYEEDKGPREPKPPLSYSSLIASDVLQLQNHNLKAAKQQPPDDSEDNEDSVDQLLDDALEESYRSVLEEGEEQPHSQVLKDKDILRLASEPPAKRPPSEKPPPPPPVEETTSQLKDHELDHQERQILAAVQTIERDQKEYLQLKNLVLQDEPTTSPVSGPLGAGASVNKKESKKENKPLAVNKPLSSAVSQPQLNVSRAHGTLESAVIKKRVSETSLMAPSQKGYHNHWLIQEAEQRRITDLQQRTAAAGSSMGSSVSLNSQISPVYENLAVSNNQLAAAAAPPAAAGSNGSLMHKMEPASARPVSMGSNKVVGLAENVYANVGQGSAPASLCHSLRDPAAQHIMSRLPGPQIPPRQPATTPLTPPTHDRQMQGPAFGGGSKEKLLSVSGKKKCSHCQQELGQGAAMIIESLRLFYHLHCFHCCVCHIQLGNGTAGTDVRVRYDQLHCQDCYSNDEGLKFSKV